MGAMGVVLNISRHIEIEKPKEEERTISPRIERVRRKQERERMI